MDETRKTELNAAYHTLCEYMLWRRGRTDKMSCDGKEIGVALEVAAGAILDFIAWDTRLTVAETSLRACEAELKREQESYRSLQMVLNDAEVEINRLQAILVKHGIAYGKDNPETFAPKKLTQEVFNGFDKDYRYAVVTKYGSALVYRFPPFFDEEVGWSIWDGCGKRPILDAGEGFDASDWQHSLLKRED